MAWSYTRSSAAKSYGGGGAWGTWTRSWDVTEIQATSASYVNLRVSVATQKYDTNDYSYIWYETDTITCGSQTQTIHASSAIPGNASYSKTIQVPAAWIGRSITLKIAGDSVTVTFNATQVTASTVSASDGYFGNAIPITMTPSVSGVKHTVTVNCAGMTETLLTQSTATSVNWTPSVTTYAERITSATSAQATITCTTYNGGNQMGSPQTATITVRFQDGTLPPSISSGWAVASVLNEGSAEGMTVWIQGYSKARVTFDSSKIACQYDATISSYRISCNGITDDSSPYDTGVLTGSTAYVTCTVIDSRGQTASETLSIALLPYSGPWIDGVTLKRCNADGTINDGGNCVAVRATGNITSLDGQNSQTMKVYLRSASGSYGAGQNYTSGATTVLSGTSPDASYYIKFVITDRLGNSSEYEQALQTRAWAMKFTKTGNGVAFGKAPETTKAIEVPSDWRFKRGDRELYGVIDLTDLAGLGVSISGDAINATITQLVDAMPDYSVLNIDYIEGNNTSQYGTLSSQMPNASGMFILEKAETTATCRFLPYGSPKSYVGTYSTVNSSGWSGWQALFPMQSYANQTISTDANGNAKLNLAYADYTLLFCHMEGYIISPWRSADGYWHVRITGITGSAYASQQNVLITYVFVPNDAITVLA